LQAFGLSVGLCGLANVVLTQILNPNATSGAKRAGKIKLFTYSFF